MSELSLRMKLIVVSVLFFAIPSFLIGFTGYQKSQQELDNAGKTQLKNAVRFSISMIAAVDQEVQEGKLSKEAAQELVKSKLVGKPSKSADGKIARKITQDFNLGKYGYIFVLDDKAVELAHPSLENTSIWSSKSKDGIMVGQELVKLAPKGGYLIYDWPLPKKTPDEPEKTAPKIAYSEKDPVWGWNIVAGSYLSDYNSGAQSVLNFFFIIFSSCLVAGVIVIWLLATYISKPVANLARRVERVAQGDLSVELIEYRSRDEIGRLSKSFNLMVGNWRGIVGQLKGKVQDTSEKMSVSSQELFSGAEQTKIVSAQIAQSIQDLSVGAKTQLAGSEQSANAMEEMTVGIQRIADTSRTVADVSEQTIKEAEKGGESIQKVSAQMESITRTVNQTASVIKLLDERSREIGRIVELITGIATQTNLLALNAAIEAARAGEHGRGFSVVADEVRKLAEQSGRSARDISNLVKEIQDETARAVSSMSEGTVEVEIGRITVQEAGEAFGKIMGEIKGVSEKIQDVSAVVEQILVSSEEVAGSVSNMSQIAKKSSENLQSVAAASEQQSASSNEVALSAKTLSELADDLQAALKAFEA